MRFGVLAAALLAAGLGTAAYAQQTLQQTPQTAVAEPLSIRAILDRVEAQGYRDITEVEREDGRYEVKAVDAEGRRVELKLDARTGEVVKAERK
ncbi:MAG TPA: PepSY domain-containing protein [Azospirillum sp.]|nr:PepSY domain-containing protein [Azospirillum sp.]